MAIGYHPEAGLRDSGGAANAAIPAGDAPARWTGAGLIACGLASVILLLIHPDPGGSPALSDVLRGEAAQAGPDALVHGGYVVVLALELVGFAALAVRAGPRRTAVLAAMLFALIGSGLLSGSMIVDGLVTPGVAGRYAAALPEKQEPARALLVLIGAAVRVLMPMGLSFLGAAALAWGTALAPMRGGVRIAGWIALASGAVMLASSGASLQPAGMLAMIAALLSSAAWTVTAGVLLMHWRAGPSPGR